MIKALQLNLGTLTQYQTGWYRDPATGQYYYHDAQSGQWSIFTAGHLYPLSVPKMTPPKVVDISPGDTLRIEYSYRYGGPAIDVVEYASIGWTIAGIYDEKVHVSKPRHLPASATPETYSGYIDIVLPLGTEENWNDIEAKVYNGGHELGLNYQNALNIVGVEVEFSNFAVVDYYKKE